MTAYLVTGINTDGKRVKYTTPHPEDVKELVRGTCWIMFEDGKRKVLFRWGCK